LSGSDHVGFLDNAQAPQFALLDGSRTFTGSIVLDSGLLVDGVDISVFKTAYDAHVANPDAHHAAFVGIVADGAVTVSPHSTTKLISVVGGNTITSTPTTNTVTLAVKLKPNTGLQSDSAGVYVVAGDGIIVNGSGVGIQLAASSGLQVSLSGLKAVAGDGITVGSTISVNPGNGIGIDGGAIIVDTDASFFWTSDHSFNSSVEFNSTAYFNSEPVFNTSVYFQHVLPQLTDTYDVGSSVLIWRRGYFSELNSFIFAENTIFPIGGWLIICKFQGNLNGAINTSQTSVDLGVVGMSVNDFIIFRANGSVEYMQITGITGGGVYTVLRGLSNSGVGIAWPAGSVWANFGYNGNGRIELNANDSPRIQLITQGTAYGSQTEVMRLGDLNGSWGYVAETMGLAMGEYAALKPNLTMDTTNGLRIRNYTTNVLHFKPDGTNEIAGTLNVTGTVTAAGTVVLGPSGLQIQATTSYADVNALTFVNASSVKVAQAVASYGSSGGITQSSLYVYAGGSFTEANAIFGAQANTSAVTQLINSATGGSSAQNFIAMQATSSGTNTITYSATTHIFSGVNGVLPAAAMFQTGGTTAPSSPSTNHIYFNTAVKSWWTYDGSAWRQGGATTYTGSFPVSSVPANSRVFRSDFQAYFFTNDGSSWNQLSIGTFSGSFPSSPVDNLRVYRSDRDLLYYYDSTLAVWLTVQEYQLTMTDLRIGADNTLTSVNTTGSEATWALLPLQGTYNTLITGMWFYISKTGTHDVTNNYTVALKTFDYSNAAITLTSWGSNTETAARFEKTYGTVLATSGTSGAAPNRLTVRVLKTGTPGNMSLGIIIKYRLVG
jgi:hypothetical protein